MKVECPVCGRMGFVQQRGNSCRVGHYVGYRDGTSVIEWHLVKTDGKDGKESMVKNKSEMNIFNEIKRARSSARQSGGLLIRWPRVQIPPSPPTIFPLIFNINSHS